MIKLYGFGPAFGVSDPSPFVLKVETYLKMARLDYELVANTLNLRKAPKGKLPFIEDRGNSIADSFFIIEYLKKTYGDPLDQWLSAEQKAQAYLVSKALDEDLYWCLAYSRWIDDETWPVIRRDFFHELPVFIRPIVSVVARQSIRSTLKKQGLGLHSSDDIKLMMSRTLSSLSCLLGDKKFIFSDEVCSLDVSVFAFLAEFILVDIDNSFNDMAKLHVNLVEYCHRIRNIYY